MSGVAIGIDVGGTKALALLVARDGRVLGEMVSQTPHDEGFGAGEATTTVIAPAIANAIHDATGIRLREVPFTPDRVAAALREA